MIELKGPSLSFFVKPPIEPKSVKVRRVIYCGDSQFISGPFKDQEEMDIALSLLVGDPMGTC